jgi:hypothetical protein
MVITFRRHFRGQGNRVDAFQGDWHICGGFEGDGVRYMRSGDDYTVVDKDPMANFFPSPSLPWKNL